MNKAKLALHKLATVKPVYILIFALLSTIVCLFALRANNEHMIALRNNVYTADKNDTDVTGALQQLQAYVTTHMNTDLSSGNGSVYPPVQLKYTYQRLLSKASSTVTGNTQLYTDAQQY